jgi:hypothetical protein
MNLFLHFFIVYQQVTKFPSVVEPESSSPFPSQQPATATDPDHDESSSHHQLCFFDIHTNMILPSASRFSKCRHFASGFPTRILHTFLMSTCLLHALPTNLCCMRLEDTQICQEWRFWHFLLLRYLACNCMPVYTVFVLVYRTYGRLCWNVLLSESL